MKVAMQPSARDVLCHQPEDDHAVRHGDRICVSEVEFVLTVPALVME